MSKHQFTLGDMVEAVYTSCETEYPEATARQKTHIINSAFQRGIFRFKKPAEVRRLLRELN